MSAPVAALVTGAGGPLGVNLTRSLLEAEARPRLLGTDKNRFHLPLSLCERTYLVPPASAREAYAAALAEVAAREDIQAILPTHPVEVRAVAELRDRGEIPAATALPATEVIALCDDKFRCFERLAGAGVPVPRTQLLAAPGDLARAFDELGAPLWIRGTGAPGLGIGGAALPCQHPEIGRAWVEHHGGWGRMAASELLPGANLTWTGGFDRGRLCAAGSRERLEYVLPHVAPSGVTGAPAVTRTIGRADVADLGERAVRSVDPEPHGVYFVDMKEDASGRPRVTEINAGRCGTTIHFYTRAGFNFPELLLCLALGESPALPADPNRAIESDLYWVRTLDCGPVLLRGEEAFDAFPSAGRGDDV